MAEPARKFDADIEADVRPNLTSVQGGGQSTPDRANLRTVKNLEENPDKPTQQDDASTGESTGSNVIRGPWKNSGSDANWQTSVIPGASSTKQKMTATGFLKKNGPLGIILAVVLGGGVFAGLALPSFLLIHVQEMMMERFNVQETSMSIRANRLIANKLTGQATQGLCTTVVNIGCKFARPSNRFLANMEKNGIKALDSSGNTVQKRGVFPNARPVTYVFTDSLGYSYNLTPEEFAKAVREDPRIRSAFFKSYNPRVAGVSDAVFKLIQKRFNFSKTNKSAGAKTPGEVDERRISAARGTDTGAARAAANGTGTELIENLVRQHATKLFSTLRQAGKGSAVSLVAGGVCLATNIPKVIISVARAYQMAQLVRFAMSIATPTSAQKAGSPSFTPEIASSLGTLVMSSINSFGMRYTLFGDTNPGTSNYKRVVAGSSVVSVLGGANQVTQSQEVKNTCSVATNPATGTAINAALVAGGGASAGTTIIVAGVNFLGGLVISELVGFLMPHAINFGMWVMEPHMENILATLMGDFTENMTDEETGAAYAGGMAHALAETANAGGDLPLTVNQAVAQKETARKVQLAYAEADRATLSPFDISNKNTFMGSFVNSFLPYIASMQSVSGVLKTIASIPLLSMKSLVNPIASAAEDPAAEFKLCDDPALLDENVAAGPFCEIKYGIPEEYLNGIDPQENVEYLIASGDINATTGEPIDKGDEGAGASLSLKGFIDLCMQGGSDFASSCKIGSEDGAGSEERAANDTLARYAVYMIDKRIQETMDEEILGSAGATLTDIVLPVNPGYRVSSPFGPRKEPCEGCSTWHRGIDFTGGDFLVKSMLAGTVTGIGDRFGNNTVTIDHGNGLKTLYLHMHPSNILVSVGDIVTTGQVIGKMGAEGQSTGVHLHFTIEADSSYEGFTRTPDGLYIDPAQFFERNGITL